MQPILPSTDETQLLFIQRTTKDGIDFSVGKIFPAAYRL